MAMKPGKPIFADSEAEALVDNDREERRLALEHMAEAWNAAEDEGIEPQALAHACLFAAITTFVQNYGEEAAAELVAGLPERIRHGEYNLTRSLQ